MEKTMDKSRTPHHGRNIMRIRELQGLKQEALAALLGISQQSVSKMEKSETIEDEKLEQVAKALGVSSEGIKNFSEEAAIYNIQHNSDSSANNSIATNNEVVNYNMNTLEKVVELYERLLASEREKVEILKGKK